MLWRIGEDILTPDHFDIFETGGIDFLCQNGFEQSPAMQPVQRVTSLCASSDVRHNDEWCAGHLPHTIHLNAGRLPLSQPPVSRDERIIVHCGHADRSAVGLSLLERWGY
jgi:hypothetical protein